MDPAARLLLLAAVSWLSAAATADIVNITCSAARNYTDDSPYGKDVAELQSALATPPPATPGNHWWYRSRTVGQVSGLAMCYADADAERCLDILNNGSEFSTLCDHSRSLGYLDSIVGLAYGYTPSTDSSSGDPGTRLLRYSDDDYGGRDTNMREARGALLSRLADAAGSDALRFAAGSQGYNGSVFMIREVLYGMAQCALDLSPDECRSCLFELVAATYTYPVMWGSRNRPDARIMGLTCYIRYQINEPITFIPGMVAEPPAPPPAAPTGSAAAAAPPMLLVAALLAATLFISAAVYY
ncbi:unnamed protein product [Urochloa humidicola]